MNLLWQIVQDDSKVEQSIADAALSQLCKVVSAYTLRIHRNMLIQIFCDHIRNRVSVHQSIVLLQKVLRTQSFSFHVAARSVPARRSSTVFFFPLQRSTITTTKR